MGSASYGAIYGIFRCLTAPFILLLALQGVVVGVSTLSGIGFSDQVYFVPVAIGQYGGYLCILLHFVFAVS